MKSKLREAQKYSQHRKELIYMKLAQLQCHWDQIEAAQFWVYASKTYFKCEYEVQVF